MAGYLLYLLFRNCGADLINLSTCLARNNKVLKEVDEVVVPGESQMVAH